MTSALSGYDTHLWAEGRHWRIYDKLGAHLATENGKAGTRFSVWAPNAAAVSVIGDFNEWRRAAAPLEQIGQSGIWTGFLQSVSAGAQYKYAIDSRVNGYKVDKTDPFGRAFEHRPNTASVVADLRGYEWNDGEHLEHRRDRNALSAPITIYEVHLGSWRRSSVDNRWLSYREVAPLLADYAHKLGYTHVELLPITEHPFDGSWGYQPTGYFAPTSRFGSPQDFMFLVDTLHQQGIGVILDWVPAHFPRDEHGLSYFDGTHLFEHADPRRGAHQDWGTLIFNYGRNEVANFLISNALFWLDVYHIDGLRVDAVASMLYLDYSREEGQWLPNEFGGRENLEAIAFLKRLNEQVYEAFPGTMTIAEESTAWPMTSRPTYLGGLGFGYKWDMGWMHDTLGYMSHDPVHRKYHHNSLSFRMLYAFSENYLLPLSHDEVVHGKGSLINKMPGDQWRQFANLRALFGYMYMQPGKKLLFMGGEIGQRREWDHDGQIDWHLLDEPEHQGLQRWVRDLNTIYRAQPALHVHDCDPEGFEWIDANDSESSVVSFIRRAAGADDEIVVVCNFTPLPRHNYRVGVPRGGQWREILNSDAPLYGGSGQGNLGEVTAAPVPCHGRPYLLNITIPPLAVVAFKRKRASGGEGKTG